MTDLEKIGPPGPQNDHRRPVSSDPRSHAVRTEQTLTPTASFWLDNLERFDPRHEGPQWERPVASLIDPTLQTDDQLTGLVSEAIVIQQFLLEVLTRRGLSRASVVEQLRRLLAPPPASAPPSPARPGHLSA
jgi:hypothetical protein